MLEFWESDQTCNLYLRLMLAIHEEGEYSGMQYVGFFASKLTNEMKTDLFVDSWLQDFQDLEELLIHVERTSAFEQASRLSDVDIEIDSGHV